MNEQQLYDLADKLSLKWWGVKYDGLIELKNRRWKNTRGQFIKPLKSVNDGRPIIEMCSKRNAERTAEEVEGTLLHELVHWRLWSIGLPHRDHNKEFVLEAIRVEAPISGAKNAQLAFEKYSGTEK